VSTGLARGVNRSVGAPHTTGQAAQRGFLIVNADDWGRDARTTQCILDCVAHKTVSAVSAMVFMEDSDRAAAIAVEHAIDAGLHLNFTSPFTSASRASRLAEHQRRLTAHLRRHRLAPIVFNPTLVTSFEYVVAAQIDEFRRLYGADPVRLDGHHHMHLCANVLLGGLLPPGAHVRRNFSFQSGEKSVVNRTYRRFVDRMLARRHRLADYLFSLPPLEPPSRLERIFSLARQHIVEVETHPVQPEEHRFLMGGGIVRTAGDVRIAPFPSRSRSERNGIQ
jgi:chitin disaccharide deacetylase